MNADTSTPSPSKKDLILGAAVRVFARDGLEKGKIADIAREAGIGKGTVYEYFRSKEEIFSAIIDHMMSEVMVGMETIAASDIPTRQKLESIIDYSFDVLDFHSNEEWPIVMEIFAQGVRDRSSSSLAKTVQETFAKSFKALDPLIEAGISEGIFRPLSADLLGFIIFASLDGLALHAYLQRDRINLAELKSATKKVLFEGLLQPAS